MEKLFVGLKRGHVIKGKNGCKWRWNGKRLVYMKRWRFDCARMHRKERR